MTVKKITIDGMDNFGVDEENKLYWKGKPVVTKEEITLSKWVNRAIIAGGFSTLALAVIGVIRLF